MDGMACNRNRSSLARTQPQLTHNFLFPLVASAIAVSFAVCLTSIVFHEVMGCTSLLKWELGRMGRIELGKSGEPENEGSFFTSNSRIPLCSTIREQPKIKLAFLYSFLAADLV